MNEEPVDRNENPKDERQPDAAPIPPPASVEPRGDLSLGLGVALLLGLIVVVFAVQNTEAVAIKFLAWNFSMPLAMVVFLVAVIAAISDELFGLVTRRRRRRRQAEKAELKQLRAQSKRR